MKKSIQDQWNRLLELPSANSRLTRELYETLCTRCNMIAHFDRNGFHKARFWTLDDFDQTLALMCTSETGRKILKNTDSTLIANARYKIACLEAGVVITQARIMQEHVIKLQSKFSRKVI